MKINSITVQLQLGESLIRFYTEQPSESQGLEGRILQAICHDQLVQHTLHNLQLADIAAAVENLSKNLSLLEPARAVNKYKRVFLLPWDGMLAHCMVIPSIKDPVLPIEHCTLRSLGGHFCDVENSEAFVCGQNRTL